MLTLEGLVARFADAVTMLPAGDLRQTRALIARHLDTTATPTVFAALYGDEAAISVGYPALGVPPWGGFGVAHEVARHEGWEPLAALGNTASLPSFEAT
jgi:hypothetical protein